MKISDLEKVGKLKSEREYLLGVRDWARSPVLALSIRTAGGKIDLRPDLAAAVAAPLDAAAVSEIVRVDTDLAALGVTAGGDD